VEEVQRPDLLLRDAIRSPEVVDDTDSLLTSAPLSRAFRSIWAGRRQKGVDLLLRQDLAHGLPLPAGFVGETELCAQARTQPPRARATAAVTPAIRRRPDDLAISAIVISLFVVEGQDLALAFRKLEQRLGQQRPQFASVRA